MAGANARRVGRAQRRRELVDAAARVFRERGVDGTAVSDVVRAAGVAQGTFYLYFDSKDEVVSAVAERLVETLLEKADAADTADETGGSAVERLRRLTAGLAAGAADPESRELIDFLHRRENRAVHDRMAEHLLPRLAAVCRSIIDQGVDEGVFRVEDPASATWFVLGGLQSVELAGTAVERMPAALERATALALRSLGYAGARS